MQAGSLPRHTTHITPQMVRLTLEAVYLLAHFLAPILPYSATAIFRKLGQPPRPIPELQSTFLNLTDGGCVRLLTRSRQPASQRGRWTGHGFRTWMDWWDVLSRSLTHSLTHSLTQSTHPHHSFLPSLDFFCCAGSPVEIGDILFVKIDPTTLAADGDAAPASAPAPAPAPAPAAPPKPAKGTGGENGGKPKKEKGGKGGKGCGGAAPEEEVDPGNPNALHMVVGTIVKAWPHPESEKLWCEEIDVGEEVREQEAGCFLCVGGGGLFSSLFRSLPYIHSQTNPECTHARTHARRRPARSPRGCGSSTRRRRTSKVPCLFMSKAPCL